MRKWAVDILFLTLLVGAGYSLISFYLGYEYLHTGYADWMYHAFRTLRLSQFGLSSWDHVWDNGINHWQGYPFGVHALVLFISILSHWSITYSMMFLTVCVFVLIRVLSYITLRFLGVRSLYAFAGCFISYAFVHQWVAISDFALFVVLLYIPLFVFVWSKATERPEYFFIVAALAGFSWGVHPILGYTLTGMFVILILFRKHLLKRGGLVSSLVIFSISFVLFVYSQFFVGESFSNPLLSSPQFWQSTITAPYIGLSLLYVVLVGLGWGIIFLNADRVPGWAKLLHLYCTLFLLFIWTGLNGYIPGFIGSLQISRAITLVGFLFTFSFAALLQVLFDQVRSRLLFGVLASLVALSYVGGIEFSSQFSGAPVSRIDNPVAVYFAVSDPIGSVYVESIADASYLARPTIRYVTSYNEHREPHPLGERFKRLMKTDGAYTGVTHQQFELINAYSRVLGVEYIFLPEQSPLIQSLTTGSEAIFKLEAKVPTTQGIFSVLKIKTPIHYAYVSSDAPLSSLFSFDTLPKPTLYADSYEKWDEAVVQVYTLIEKNQLQGVPVTFVYPDSLTVDLSAQPNARELVIIHSYDKNWQDELHNISQIRPTSLFFMHVQINKESSSSAIVIRNSWPIMFWLLQGFTISNVVAAAGMTVYLLVRARRLS